MIPWIDKERLIAVLADCETGHLPEAERDTARGDGGAAVGRWQIHKIMVDEVNRILGTNVFRYEDRENRAKSHMMAGIFYTHWLPRMPLAFRQPDRAARMWNGGPRAYKWASTEKYGRDFMRRWEGGKA